MNNEIEISPLYTKLVLEIEAIRKEYSILWEGSIGESIETATLD